MGTHPIFESDFDCLTVMLNNVSRSVARVLPRASIVSSRAAHTDKEFPNLEYYRMKGASGIVTPTEFHEKEGDRVRDAQGAAYMMTGTVAAVTAFSAGNFVWKAVSTLNPTRSVRALASIEVEIGDIPVGKTCMFKWRGKPIFIKHRDEEEIAREAAVDVASLRDPQADTDRFINPGWFVLEFVLIWVVFQLPMLVTTTDTSAPVTAPTTTDRVEFDKDQLHSTWKFLLLHLTATPA